MKEKSFLERYGGESVEELLALERTHRIDSIVGVFESLVDARRETLGDASINRVERTILVIEALEREVNNGGYHQFFLNSSHEFAGDVVQALEEIGCPQHAEIAKQALARLGIEGGVTPEKVQEKIQGDDDGELIDALEPHADAYYACEEDIAGRLFAFIRANQGSIRLP
jgi:hypothetical protein